MLVNVYQELATNYDLDGIEYDFVRYPASNLYTFSGNITDSSLIDDLVIQNQQCVYSKKTIK